MTRDASGVNDKAIALVQGDEIFFRAEDAHLIDSLSMAIAGDLTSLELIGASKPAIDHYGRILLTRLRQIPNVQLEAYLPTGVESLVDQFNAALSSISMAEATGGGNPANTIKVFISNEISAGNSRDGRMLARLVSNFPGANIKLVWVHQDVAEGPRAAALEFAGKHAARWFISPPTAEEAERMLADGLRAGQEERVQQLLKKVAPDALLQQSGDVRPRRLTARQEPVLKGRPETPLAETAPALPRRDSSGESDSTDGSARKIIAQRKMSWLAMFNGIFLVTCLSAIVIALIFPGHIQALAEMLGISPSPIKPLQGARDPAKIAATAAPLLLPPAASVEKKQADESAAAANPAPRAEPPGAANPPAAANSAAGKDSSAGNASVNPKELPVQAVTSPTAKPAAATATVAVPNETAGKAMAKSDAVDSAAIAAPRLKTPSSTTGGANAPVAAAQADSKSTAGDAVKTVPPANKNTPRVTQPGGDPLSKAAAQINAAKKGNFFVQFVALESYAAALAWRDKYDKLARAQIAQISVEQGAKSKFVVLSGPFKSRGAAEAFAAQKGLPDGAWIRAARPLQAALQKTANGAPAKKTQEQKSE